MRYNSVGIRREDLAWALNQRNCVAEARKINACMLCRRNQVNEAGLCDFCLALLNDEELEVATKWISGVRRL